MIVRLKSFHYLQQLHAFHITLKGYSVLFFKRKEPKESAFLQCLSLLKHL